MSQKHIVIGVEPVRHLLSHFKLSSIPAILAARERLHATLRLSMANTTAYGHPIDPLPIRSLEPEALFAATNPVTLAAAALTLSALLEAHQNPATEPVDVMLYADGWVSVSGLSFPAASALAIEYLPRRLDPEPAAPQAPQQAPAQASAAPQQAPQQAATPAATDAGKSAPTSGRLPEFSLQPVPQGGPGRPRRSPFEHDHSPRKSVAATPGWVGDLIETLPRVLHESADAIIGDDRTLGAVEAYATSVELLRRSVAGLDPAMSVGELQSWLEVVVTTITGSKSGPALTSFMARALAAREKQG